MSTPQSSSSTPHPRLFWFSVATLCTAILLRLFAGPDAAFAAALIGGGIAIWGSMSPSTSGPGRSLTGENLQGLIKELRTIPTLPGNIRIEFSPDKAPIQRWLQSLPADLRAVVEAFFDRATRRVRDAQFAQPQTTTEGTRTTSSEPGAARAGSTPVPSGSQTPGPALRIDTILIDDEESVHLNWKVAAGRAGKTVLTFRSVDEILALPGLSRIPTDTRFVVDSQLGQGVRGVQAAKVLFDRGFKNLQLAHAAPQKLLDPTPTWIRRVVDKTPIFE